MRRGTALGLLLVGLVGLVLLPASPAAAHPLGNFTINTYSGLRVGVDGISVDFLVDMAEVPTLQRWNEVDGDGDGVTSPGERAAYADGACHGYLDHLDLRVDERRVPLRLASSGLVVAEGQAGLFTQRVDCTAAGPIGPLDGRHRVTFASGNFTDRAGWREITAVGDRATLVKTDVPSDSVSGRLARYPDDLLSSPLDQRTANLLVEPGGPAAATADAAAISGGEPSPPATLLPRGVDRATRAFTSFVNHRDLTVGFAALALVASIALGAVHAFAPGHGKTVMAAYLVGQKGSLRHALGIAFTVTATHTVGVLALGIAISASAVVAPERLYPWLGTASGVLLAAIGAGFLLRIVRTRRDGHGHDHGHPHGHGHDHGHGTPPTAPFIATMASCFSQIRPKSRRYGHSKSRRQATPTPTVRSAAAASSS